MNEVDVVTLEDGINYIILCAKYIDNIEYLYLSNLNNPNDYVIRKSINNELVGLDDEEEFDKVIKVLTLEYMNQNKNKRVDKVGEQHAKF